jgi:ubiquinone/menaquinone biosynthesis C-methylase UbiE
VPVVEQRTAVAAVFDRAAQTYDQVGVEFFAAVGRQLVSDAGLSAGQRVLDVGCGRGAVLFPAAAAVGESGSVLGIDLAPAMIELTAADAAAAGLANVRVAVMDAQEPQLDDASFDAVLSSLVVYFLPEPLTGLIAWQKALRPGGRLALSTFVDRQDDRWSWLQEILPTRDPHATQEAGSDSTSPFDTDASLHSLLAEAGFVDPVSRTREHVVRFADPDQWLRWSWSHGMRMYWERLPEDDQSDARMHAVERLQLMQAEPQGLVLRNVVRYTTAQAPS